MERFAICKVLFDPWQMQACAALAQCRSTNRRISAVTGQPDGCPQNLYELITVAKPSPSTLTPAMRLAISRAIATETPTWLAHLQTNTVHKIDVVVALAMACHAAVQGKAEDYYDLSAAMDLQRAGATTARQPCLSRPATLSGAKHQHADAQLRP